MITRVNKKEPRRGSFFIYGLNLLKLQPDAEPVDAPEVPERQKSVIHAKARHF